MKDNPFQLMNKYELNDIIISAKDGKGRERFRVVKKEIKIGKGVKAVISIRSMKTNRFSQIISICG